MVQDALADHLREQAHFCDSYGSPFTARLLERMLDDLEAGGPVAKLAHGWPGSPRADAVGLRLAGALHAAALTGRDPALAEEYPDRRSDWDIERVWPLARALLVRERAWVSEFIRLAPQTNEVRRSIALLTGFLHFARELGPDFDTLEIGASAGLNLSWDSYSYQTPSWTWGADGGVAIDTEWDGPAPASEIQPLVRSRAACDQNPLDLRDPGQRLRLRAYIWADQPERLKRFERAADLAVQNAVHVERADALSWLAERLRARAPDRPCIVYHSVFWQYPPPEKRAAMGAAIRATGEQATSAAPLGWLRLEPEAVLGGPRESARFLVDLLTWPGGERRVLAITDGHVRSVCTRERELRAAEQRLR